MGVCFKYAPPITNWLGHLESDWVLIGHTQRPPLFGARVPVPVQSSARGVILLTAMFKVLKV